MIVASLAGTSFILKVSFLFKPVNCVFTTEDDADIPMGIHRYSLPRAGTAAGERRVDCEAPVVFPPIYGVLPMDDHAAMQGIISE